MNLEQFVDLLEGVRGPRNGKYQFRCPAHEDKTASAWCAYGRYGDNAIVVGCSAGCAVHDITAALGIRVADLFPDSLTLKKLSFMERQRAIAAARKKTDERKRARQAIAQAQIAIIACMDVCDDIADGRKPTKRTRDYFAAKSMELHNADAYIRGFDC